MYYESTGLTVIGSGCHTTHLTDCMQPSRVDRDRARHQRNRTTKRRMSYLASRQAKTVETHHLANVTKPNPIAALHPTPKPYGHRLTCTVDGCSENRDARGLCNKHYQRAWQDGAF